MKSAHTHARYYLWATATRHFRDFPFQPHHVFVVVRQQLVLIELCKTTAVMQGRIAVISVKVMSNAPHRVAPRLNVTRDRQWRGRDATCWLTSPHFACLLTHSHDLCSQVGVCFNGKH